MFELAKHRSLKFGELLVGGQKNRLLPQSVFLCEYHSSVFVLFNISTSLMLASRHLRLISQPNFADINLKKLNDATKKTFPH